jgi:hypothetical protein
MNWHSVRHRPTTERALPPCPLPAAAAAAARLLLGVGSLSFDCAGPLGSVVPAAVGVRALPLGPSTWALLARITDGFREYIQAHTCFAVSWA